MLPKHDRDAQGQVPFTPKAALLFCAYNEELNLPQKIANLRQIKALHPSLEILAYSDASTDATNTLLKEASDILTPVVSLVRQGKVRGMWHLVEMTKADIVIFTDANVLIEPAGVSRLLGYFERSDIGAVAGTLVYSSRQSSVSSATERTGGAYWRLEEWIKREESRSGSMMGADGALFARRRKGYPQLPAELVDDLAVSISVLFEGARCVSAPDVFATECAVSDSAEEFRRKRRIACGSYSTYRYLSSSLAQMEKLDRFKFFSHKLMRWWGGFFLFLAWFFAGAAFAIDGFALSYGMASLLLFLFGFLASRLKVPVVSELYEVVQGIVATSLGVLESLLGKRYETWEPASTR